MKHKYKVIIFDLSEVLLTGFLGVENRLAQILRMPEIDIWKTLDSMGMADLFHNKMTEDEYWNVVLKNTGWEISKEQLKKAIRNNFSEIEGTREIIKKLRKRYKVGLLSVHAKEWAEYLNATFNHHVLFDEISYSYEVGVSKPDPQSYLKILDKFKVSPEKVVFIDDSLKNVEAARKLGITGIQFEDAKQLKKELKTLGIM